MVKNNKKPRLRFKGFTDEWEQRKLGEIGRVAMNRRIFKEQTSASGEVPFYKIGTFGGEPDAFISDELYQKYKEQFPYPKVGDILLSASGSVGKMVEYKGEKAYFQDSNIVWLEHDTSVSNSFLKCFYAVVKWAGLEGSTIKRLYNKNILETQISLPLYKEQLLIGDLFEQIDNLITLHQRKYDKLLNVKKALLDKMFPKNQEKTPKIRFKGFFDTWEQRKLGEIAQITMGQSPDGSTYSDKPLDYILVQGNADLVDGWVYPRIWTSQKTKTCQVGDLIMSVRAPAGSVGKTLYNAVIGRGVAAIKGNEFLFQNLVKMDNNSYWKLLSCGSTFESLNSDNIKNAKIKIPSEIEQAKIGDFFYNLDNLITLHQRKCEKLKNIKKALLDKMFV